VRAGLTTSGPNVGRELTFENGDLVLQVKLAFLEALQLQLVLDGALRKAGNNVIEVAVLKVQLVNALPEHFTVGGMYHGHFPHTDFDALSISLKKIKNEMLPGIGRLSGARVLRSCFYV
jgi:hypothetical protein